MKKILLIVVIGLFTIITTFLLFIQFTWKTDLSSEFPVKDIVVNADSAMLANGKYLVYGPAHCTHCHVPIEQLSRVDAGEELPMIGGFEFNLPFGVIRTPNITPDIETGIGRYTDGQLYRMLRHNIKHDGLVAPEFMPFKDMSEYDIRSVIAYLRSTKPVAHQVAENEVNLLGKAIFKFAIRPTIPVENIPEKVKRDSSILYGKYLSESVANCRGCHTARDMSTGAFIGPDYAGGMEFEPSPETMGWYFNTPNLTNPDENPIMASEQDFIRRFKAGRLIPASPMPWGSFKHLTDSDLKAIYRYIKSKDRLENPEAGKSIPPQATASIK